MTTKTVRNKVNVSSPDEQGQDIIHGQIIIYSQGALTWQEMPGEIWIENTRYIKED